MILQQFLITTLTVAAFALSAAGAFGARQHASNAVKRMESERVDRNAIGARHTAAQAAAGAVVDHEDAQRLRDAAHAEWLDGHEQAGLEPVTYDSVDHGREFLAERIIRELDAATRSDITLIAIGLLCGLAASIWGTWLA